MPWFEYICLRCGHKFDDMLSATEPNPPCPVMTDGVPCDGEVVRIPSVPSRALGGPTPIHYRNRGA